jgi:hypothetical protein
MLIQHNFFISYSAFHFLLQRLLTKGIELIYTSFKEFKDIATKSGVVSSKFYYLALKNEVLGHKTEGHLHCKRGLNVEVSIVIQGGELEKFC